MMLISHLRRSGFISSAIAFAALCGPGAATPALGYDDKSTVSSVLEMVGVGADKEVGKIDYRERSKLVIPPNRQALPAPRASGDAASGNAGLVDVEALRRDLGPGQSPAASVASSKPGAGGDTPCSGENRKDCWTLIPGQKWIAPASSGGRGSFRPLTETARKYLTEPPVDYVKPTKELPATQEKASWWNPLAFIKETAGRVSGGGQ